MANENFQSTSEPSEDGFVSAHAYFAEAPGHECAWVVTLIKTKDEVPQRPMLLIQVFHTDIGKLSSRAGMTPLDNDDRRPMFKLAFDSPEKALTWFRKNYQHLIAAALFVPYPDNPISEMQTAYFGSDQMTLHYFTAWLNHLLRRDPPRWCTAYVESHGDGVWNVCCPGILTADDFNAVLVHRKRIEECQLLRLPADSATPRIDPNRSVRDQVLKLIGDRYAQETGQAPTSP
jgi:hypothetical protein